MNDVIYDKVVDLLLSENLIGEYNPEKLTITMYGVGKWEHPAIKKMINKLTKKYSYNVVTKDEYSNVFLEFI